MRSALCTALCLTLACSTVKTRAASEGRFVQSLREEYRALGRIQSVLGWYQATQGEESLGQLTYLGHDRLFNKTAVEAVGRAALAPGLSPNDALALRFLRRALAGETVLLATAKFDDEYANAEVAAKAVVPGQLGGKPVAYRDLSLLIGQEPDAARRKVLFAAMTGVIEATLNPILERKEAAAQLAARETGFADYVALSEELRAVKLEPLLAQGVEYLKATQTLFEQLLDRVAREELGIPRSELRIADLTRLWKAPRLAAHFDKALELKALAHFLSGIGLDLHTAAGGEVQVDDSLNPKKRPRAFVNPVDAPRDVRLSVKPTGGLDDYWTLFHEAGHAVHFASSTIEPKELITLGHGAPTEAFGEFFRQAFSDPHWLLRYRDFLVAQGKAAPTRAELAAVLRRTALVEMMYLRRYTFAKIAYELRLHGRPLGSIEPALALLPHRDRVKGDDADSLRELYRELLSAAYTFELSAEEAERFRTDVDDSFYSADYSRCFALAGMMHEGIRKRFGADWYGNKEVGRFLRSELFSQGEALSAEQVAARLGFPAQVDFALSARRAAQLVLDADALEKAP